jgi:phosphoesterase RecJ-like protein
MASYDPNITMDEAVQLLREARQVVVVTHAKPDGDAFGSVVAAAAALRHLGIGVHPLIVPPIPMSFGSLKGADLVRVHEPQTPLPAADLHLVVDTGAWSQLHPLRPLLEPHMDRTLLIDHHISGDVPARWRLIDKRAAACCEVLAEVIERLNRHAPVNDAIIADAVVNESLFVGIASDTGWFRFSNTRPRTHELAARLLDRGVDHSALYARLEQTERVQKLKLMIRALDSLELVAHDRAALMVLGATDFADSGAMLEETERLVDIPQAVASVQVVVLVTEPPPLAENGAAIRVSFRSKPGPGAVNVAEMAHEFGGGGHARAAGAKIQAPLEEVVRRVKAALSRELGESAGPAV